MTQINIQPTEKFYEMLDIAYEDFSYKSGIYNDEHLNFLESHNLKELPDDIKTPENRKIVSEYCQEQLSIGKSNMEDMTLLLNLQNALDRIMPFDELNSIYEDFSYRTTIFNNEHLEFLESHNINQLPDDIKKPEDRMVVFEYCNMQLSEGSNLTQSDTERLEKLVEAIKEADKMGGVLSYIEMNGVETSDISIDYTNNALNVDVLYYSNDKYEELAERTSLFQDVGMNFDELLHDTDATMVCTASLLAETGELEIILSLQSEDVGYRDYEIKPTEDDKEFFMFVMKEQALKEGLLLDEILENLKGNIMDENAVNFKNSIDGRDEMLIEDGYVNVLLSVSDQTLENVLQELGLEPSADIDVYANLYTDESLLTSKVEAYVYNKDNEEAYPLSLSSESKGDIIQSAQEAAKYQGTTLESLYVEAYDSKLEKEDKAKANKSAEKSSKKDTIGLGG